MRRVARHEYLHLRPMIRQMARRNKGISPIIPGSGQDADRLSMDTSQEVLRRLCGLMSRIFHEKELRDPELLRCLLVNRPHLIHQGNFHRHPSITHCAVAYSIAWLRETCTYRTPFFSARSA